MQSDNGTRGSSLAKRNISDTPATAKNADATLLPPSEVGEALVDITPSANLNGMSS